MTEGNLESRVVLEVALRKRGWQQVQKRGRSDTFTVRLAFIRTLGQAFKDVHAKTFGETFLEDQHSGAANQREFVFALEGIFISTFAFIGKEKDRYAQQEELHMPQVECCRGDIYPEWCESWV